MRQVSFSNVGNGAHWEGVIKSAHCYYLNEIIANNRDRGIAIEKYNFAQKSCQVFFNFLMHFFVLLFSGLFAALEFMGDTKEV